MSIPFSVPDRLASSRLPESASLLDRSPLAVIAAACARIRSTGRSTRPAVNQATNPTTTSDTTHSAVVASAASRVRTPTGARDIAATTTSGPTGEATRTAYTSAVAPSSRDRAPTTVCCLLTPVGSRYIAGLPDDSGSPPTTWSELSSTWTRGTPGPTGIGIGSGSTSIVAWFATVSAASVTRSCTELVCERW